MKSKRRWYQQGKKPISEARLLQVLNNLAEGEYDQGTRAELIECCGYLSEKNSDLSAKYAHFKVAAMAEVLEAISRASNESDDLFKPIRNRRVKL